MHRSLAAMKKGDGDDLPFPHGVRRRAPKPLLPFVIVLLLATPVMLYAAKTWQAQEEQHGARANARDVESREVDGRFAQHKAERENFAQHEAERAKFRQRAESLAEEPLALRPAAIAVAAQASPPPPAADSVVLRFAVSDGKELSMRIALRPDLSASSVAFLKAAATAGCGGNLYRSESFLMQGRISCAGGTTPAVVKGDCPPGTKTDANRRCPSHDPNCGCHGPIMEPYMVGWAGGGTGPDWFVYTGDRPAMHWSHDHTVVGQVLDDASRAALRELNALPAGGSGMRMLTKAVPLKVGFQ